MKNVITLFMLTLSSGLFAQEFSGKATYQTKRIYKDVKDSEDGKESVQYAELVGQLREAMKKASEKTYFLEFTKDESYYWQEEKLEQPTPVPSRGGARITAFSFSSSTDGKLYKNLKEGYSLLENDYLDKSFLIKNDSLHNHKWELGTETKQIGNYLAFKATRTVKGETKLSVFADNEEEKSTDLLAKIEREPKELVYTAWYTPEIPTPNGPEIYGGLPGLILELHTPNEVYLCSELVLNPKNPIKIKVPKGKITSQKEYDDMVKKRFEKSKNGKGRSVEVIEIGG